MYEGLFPSFLIAFRESLEAALIIVIMAAYLQKLGKTNLNRYLYLGSGAAIAASIILAGIVQAVYGGLTGIAAETFEGVASLTAAVVLSYMIFWMSKHAQTIKGELQEKIEIAVTEGQLFGIAILAFVAVFREGLETVLFLTGTFFLDPLGTIIGVLIGFVVVFVLALLLIRGVYQLDVRKFFKYTSVILIIFAAGLAGYGVHELVEAGEGAGVTFGILGQQAFNINPPSNPDGSYPLLHEKGPVGSILKALVGYDGNPEWLRIIVYVGYWLVVSAYILKAYRKNDESSAHKN
ncbi:ferrous iron transporter [Candidatus Bathyarchaeota archaeon]|nr:ferrous iron transporter [Candidatus Bathyarchaeota archaeon]